MPIETEISQRLHAITAYTNASGNAIRQLKAAEFSGQTTDINKLTHEIEVLLDEVQKEVTSIKRIDLAEEAVKTAVREKLIQVLNTAGMIVEKQG